MSSLLFGYATAVIAGGWRHQSQLSSRAISATPPPMRWARCVRAGGYHHRALIARPTASLLGHKRPMIIAAICHWCRRWDLPTRKWAWAVVAAPIDLGR
jgi:hypothetical protein